ncbi:SH2 domain-containing protein 2A isoform X2 [Numida meleagris]|uniref:SH2 domain-containing protein 2A isoform X2 n=1 Tax=Numida meleagris TaxID=8996 RepID=UPI000B3DDA99|nr:SH2 domain-containing protein 2A isoform X2 [Numida meleagris]
MLRVKGKRAKRRSHGATRSPCRRSVTWPRRAARCFLPITALRAAPALPTPRPPGPGGGGSMDDAQPLFITFKCIAEDKAGSVQPGHGTTPPQPQSAEQHDARGRGGQGAAGGPQPQPQPPLAPCQVLQGCSQPEGAAASLRARNKLWFEQTQVHRLGATGKLPAWFHGFISRRDAEQMLQDEPLGCFLVRFSESTVGFVLSYRGRERCRHFVLDQLPDGRYVILGEHSAHPELAELLQHYTRVPIPPYGELLTVPRGQDKARGATDSSSPSCNAPANHPAYSTIAKRVPGDGQAAAERGPEEAPSIPLPLPAKVSSSVATQRPRSPAGSEEAEPNSPSTQPHPEAIPVEMLDAKYQQLVRFHTYADPHEGTALPVEPIPFYAMGWRSSPNPEANIYAEVATAQQEPPPRSTRGPGSVLAPTTFLRRRLFRSLSSQGFPRRQLPATPTASTMQRAAPRPAPEIPQVPVNPALEFDDPVYSPRTSSAKQAAAPENIYEQVPRDHP